MASLKSPTVPALLALLALSACATAPAPAGKQLQVNINQGPTAGSRSTSAYGLYLAGQAALDAGDSQGAANYFDLAAGANPGADFIKERVFTSALLAGDLPRASASAPGPDEGSPASQALGILAQGVELLAEGKGKEAYAKFSTSTPGLPTVPPTLVLKPWAAAAAGRWPEALILPMPTDRLMKLIGGLDQALLFERAGRYPEAETAFKALLADNAGRSITAPSYGVFLERRGRQKEAVALYDDLVAANPGEPSYLAARARAAAKGRPPPQLTIREGAAQGLMAAAAAALSDRDSEMGLVYLRLILRLDPQRDDAWLMAGDVLAATGDTQGSRDAYSRVGPKSASYAEARTRLAWAYQDSDKVQAMTTARETAAALPDSYLAQVTLADLLRADGRYDDSAQVLQPLVAKPAAAGDWRLHYTYGTALDQSGHWPEGEAELELALKIQPNQPEVLNYLGYSWVNRGERIKDGLAMIQKALDAQPDEGAYVDSLGWAYYRLGDFPKAVELLERAAMLDAGDAEMNDHLGDAYWRAGRRDEARFQWAAVLTFKPTDEVRARAEAKLASPLGPDAAVAVPAVAAK